MSIYSVDILTVGHATKGINVQIEKCQCLGFFASTQFIILYFVRLSVGQATKDINVKVFASC